MGNGQRTLGLKMASKVFIIIQVIELGKPYVFPLGRNPAKDDKDIEGKGKE